MREGKSFPACERVYDYSNSSPRLRFIPCVDDHRAMADILAEPTRDPVVSFENIFVVVFNFNFHCCNSGQIIRKFCWPLDLCVHIYNI